jgi:beta-1,4-mannosyl-glycoprotein beta-1,4-N-acetylglucosaminyltransferase
VKPTDLPRGKSAASNVTTLICRCEPDRWCCFCGSSKGLLASAATARVLARQSSALRYSAQMAPRVYDCFTFNDELDLLSVRLRLGTPHVDVFVLVEATKTFSGHPKPLHYDLNRERFLEWAPKTRHVVVDDMPITGANRWPAEVHQRNALMRGLQDARPDDIVIVGDADELVHPEVLASLTGRLVGVTALEMRSTFHRANWELPLARCVEVTRALRFGDLTDAHHQRNHERPASVIRDAGRHLTHLTDVAGMVAKYESFAHAEYDNDKDKSAAHIERSFVYGVDLREQALVRVVPRRHLCAIQEELLTLRPQLFDFNSMPPFTRRMLFKWYAAWRARQSPASRRVRWLDLRYGNATPLVAVVAAFEATRTSVYVGPRRHAGRAVRRLGIRRP